MMPEDTQEVLEKAANYVAVTQPKLDAYLEKEAAWNKQAQRTTAVLSDRGLIPAEKVDEFIDKIAENHVFALQFMEKLAKLVGSEQLGEPSDSVKIASDSSDPFVKEFFGEGSNSGMID